MVELQAALSLVRCPQDDQARLDLVALHLACCRWHLLAALLPAAGCLEVHQEHLQLLRLAAQLGWAAQEHLLAALLPPAE